MKLREIKDHGKKIVKIVEDIEGLTVQYEELIKLPVTSVEIPLSINENDTFDFHRADVQCLFEQRIETLESELQDLREEISK